MPTRRLARRGLPPARSCAQVLKKQEAISKELEQVGEDMERLQELLDELDKLNNAVIDLDIRCGAGDGELGSWGAGELGSWGAGELGSWGPCEPPSAAAAPLPTRLSARPPSPHPTNPPTCPLPAPTHSLLDKKIDQMMPELGFKPEDNERLVASFSGGWQMRMCLGKMLLQVGAPPACLCAPGCEEPWGRRGQRAQGEPGAGGAGACSC
jgi:hypothetical protein